MRHSIVREATKAHQKPFAEIGNLLDPKVSKGTVWNVLANAGYHRQVAKRVPWLTGHHRSAGQHWVKLYNKYGRSSGRMNPTFTLVIIEAGSSSHAKQMKNYMTTALYLHLSSCLLGLWSVGVS